MLSLGDKMDARRQNLVAGFEAGGDLETLSVSAPVDTGTRVTSWMPESTRQTKAAAVLVGHHRSQGHHDDLLITVSPLPVSHGTEAVIPGKQVGPGFAVELAASPERSGSGGRSRWRTP